MAAKLQSHRGTTAAAHTLWASATHRVAFAGVLLLALLFGLGAATSAVAAPLGQSAQPVAVAKFDNVPVRSGPSTNYPTAGVLSYGQSCPVTGRDITTGWWLVQCSTGVSGWVSYDVVNVLGDMALAPLLSVGGSAIIAPPEIATPAASFSGWRASYYANKDLAGAPVLVQDVPDINFQWGGGSPHPAIPANAFSARYERTLALAPGIYLLTLRMDDGARVFVDEMPVLDDWRAGSQRELSVAYPLSGNPRLRVEYFQDGGAASLAFFVTPLNAPAPVQPTPAPPWPSQAPDLAVVQNQWRAQYFNNTDLAGQPVAAQYEPRGFYPLDKYWGAAAPGGGLGTDYWSARFEGQFYFTLGDYEFLAQSDDGVRVYIDNILLINGWFDGRVQSGNRFNQVGEGYHTIRVDYFERSGNAYVRVLWNLATSGQPFTGPIPPPPT